MSFWNVLGKALGFVPAVVKVVREVVGKRGEDTGHYYLAVEWYPDGRVSVRSPSCYHCGRYDLNRPKHTDPKCPGKRQ